MKRGEGQGEKKMKYCKIILVSTYAIKVLDTMLVNKRQACVEESGVAKASDLHKGRRRQL